MRIVIAPDAFKGSLSACEAADAMAAGIHSVLPQAELLQMPLADGGEGTLAVLRRVCGGRMHRRMLQAEDRKGRFALIESARLIGIGQPGLPEELFDRGSMRLGQAMIAALDAGLRDIRIALGGTGCVDGGAGLLTALGCRLLDRHGLAVLPDLRGMMEACRIDADGLDARLWDARLTVLCDVDAPLAGPTGAVCLFAPQKGLKAEQVAPVEQAMLRWADLCEQAFAVRCRHACGAGAAGGIGFALMLLGATVESGAAYVMRACGFERQLRDADWVVTGEGRSDAQTLRGKLPARVAEAAAQRGVPTALISGDLDAAAIVPGRLFDAALAARPPGCPLAQAKADALSLLRRAAAAWAASVSGRD